MRRELALFAALGVAAGFVSEASAQGYTTRIESRPFYGAVVTLEHGVRVIRPLPPDRQVIINPNNATPLSLSINDSHVYQSSTSQNYNYDVNSGVGGGSSGYGGGFSGYDGGYGGYGRRGHGGGYYTGRGLIPTPVPRARGGYNVGP